METKYINNKEFRTCLRCGELFLVKWRLSYDPNSAYCRNIRCPDCEKLFKKEQAYRETNKVRLNEINKNRHRKEPKGRYSVYKAGAKQRKIYFDLTFDQFMEYWQLPCSYCCDEIETIGLDRIDNQIGYIIDNIVPCCTTCNRMKMAQTHDEFIEHIKKIMEHYNAI